MLILKVYGPLVTAIVSVIIAVKLRLKEKPVINLPILIIPGASLRITNKQLCRAALIALSLSNLYYYLVLDFSSFFPDHFAMEVFYDADGIKQSLSMFSEKDLADLGYSEKDSATAESYYRDLDNKLQDLLKYGGFFSLNDGTVHSQGETSFKVQKISGFHKYCIAEAKGELTHTLDRPCAQNISFKSFFEKLPSSHDYLRPDFRDIFVMRRVILQPRFKQIIAENYRSDGIVFDHTLAGVTKVRLFPVPCFENTIYFLDMKQQGLVPVAYAVYKY